LTYYQVSTKAPESRFAVLPLKYRDMETIVRQALAARGVSAEISAGDFALVSVVGEALRERLDAWDEQAKKALSDSRVEIHATSRDVISLSYLVPESQRREAVKCLHQSLVL